MLSAHNVDAIADRLREHNVRLDKITSKHCRERHAHRVEFVVTFDAGGQRVGLKHTVQITAYALSMATGELEQMELVAHVVKDAIAGIAYRAKCIRDSGIDADPGDHCEVQTAAPLEDERPADVAGGVIGYRVLFYIGPHTQAMVDQGLGATRTVEGPALMSTGVGAIAGDQWKAGRPMHAKCLVDDFGFGRLTLTGEPVEHIVPAPGCHCGFNAYHDLAGLLRNATPDMVGMWNVVAAVRGWGRVAVHTDGFRSEWVEPVAIIDAHGPRATATPATAKAAAEHAGLPLVDLDQAPGFMREYGDPVPLEHRPPPAPPAPAHSAPMPLIPW